MCLIKNQGLGNSLFVGEMEFIKWGISVYFNVFVKIEVDFLC